MMNNAFIIENGVLLKYTGEDSTVVIPNGVEIIGEHSFKNATVEKVVIPNTVRKIMCGAFENCEELCCVIATQNLTSIQIGAFTNCPNLKEVERV